MCIRDRYQAKQIKLGLEELEMGTEAVFLLIEAWHDEELDDRKISAGTPFLNADDALEYIRHDMDSAGDDYSNLCWYELQKWKPSTDPVSGKASYVHSYTYYFLKDRACFFEKLEEMCIRDRYSLATDQWICSCQHNLSDMYESCFVSFHTRICHLL